MKSLKELKKNLKKETSKLPPVKVAILGDVATQFLTIAIQGWLVENGFRAEIFEAPFNQVENQCLNPMSELHSFSAQFIIFIQSTHKLNEKYSLSDITSYNHLANERIAFISKVCQIFKKSTIICCNYPEIDDSVFGSYSNKVSSSFLYQTRKLNLALMDLSQSVDNLMICDLSSIQNKYGRDLIFDPSIYASTEMNVSVDFVPVIAKSMVDIILSIKGKEKKCVILDLDNTLWGGVIGDDGVSGIELGHGLGIGKMFTEFQEWLLKLKNRGIILCVCSKNSEEVAKQPFLNHPDMVLRLKDIAVFIANWESKVTNIRTIQKILNIGFDSMIFLDDNPCERGVVKENIPEVVVPDLPKDPSQYLEYLYSLNLFETSSYSVTDLNRTKQYKEKAEREIFQSSFDNEDDFLKSLNMKSVVSSFDDFNIPRIAQLTQRSNQFNLRTIRYTEADINRISSSHFYITRYFTLSDRFGDNGLICVVILKKQDEQSLFIETWLMSCRVLNRGMESFVLNNLIKVAKDNGFKKIIGEYLPTQKNALVKGLYSKLGFEKIPNCTTDLYQISTDNYTDRNCFIERIDNNG